MTGEEMERAIEFLIDHHAKVSSDIERHSEQIGKLTSSVSELTKEMDANRLEMREAIDNLIIANEVTRRLAEDTARLAAQNSQRISKLEEKAP